MNRTKIEWTDFTWSPVTGCLHGCPYCYARDITIRFAKNFPNGFEPTLYPHRLNEPKQRSAAAKIFVVSMGDLFGAWVPTEWIDAVITAARAAPQHTFQFLTKNPARYAEFDLPTNGWYGTTVDSLAAIERKDRLVEAVPSERIRFVSFEPLTERIDSDLTGIGWAIIGGQSRSTGAPKITPDPDWIAHIIRRARAAGTRVFVKNNAGSIRLQEYPEIMAQLSKNDKMRRSTA